MTLTDVLMIAATAFSPLIAVQVTRHLDDRNEERDRKLKVFKTLMSTRAYNLAPAHVQALNTIDLEFSAKKNQRKGGTGHLAAIPRSPWQPANGSRSMEPTSSGLTS